MSTSAHNITTWHIGISGLRHGINSRQRAHLTRFFSRLKERQEAGAVDAIVIVHGDCLGVDAEADRLARTFGFDTACFPSTIAKWRAHTGATPLAAPAHPHARNTSIVELADWLIAIPCVKSRGTWHAWRVADALARKRTLLRHDGTLWRSWIEGKAPRGQATQITP